jgi:hypothetical protein
MEVNMWPAWMIGPGIVIVALVWLCVLAWQVRRTKR